jgi:hypothetical protein
VNILKSLPEKLVRRIGFNSAHFGLRLLGARKRILLTYPEQPYPGTSLWKISKLLGWTITSELGDFQRAAAVCRWEDTTFAKSWPARLEGKRVFNRDICDISKNRMDAAHQEAFGYALGVDGKSWPRQMVVKPVENARHGGRIVVGPLSEIPDRTVCQRVMDNSDDFGGVVDLRVVYSDGEIPFGYRKMRPASERFSNTNVSASLLKPAQEFSIGELQAIVKLARLMGLDFGEMDVLRDRHDGRIFVCDVNTTPFGPPNNIIREDWVRALDLYCSAFVQMIEHTSNEMASVASCLV